MVRVEDGSGEEDGGGEEDEEDKEKDSGGEDEDEDGGGEDDGGEDDGEDKHHLQEVDRWWVCHESGILHGVVEGQTFMSRSPTITSARNNCVVTCENEDQYKLLHHRDDYKKKSPPKINRRRKIGTSANSVAQAKDHPTSQQCQTMAQRAQTF